MLIILLPNKYPKNTFFGLVFRVLHCLGAGGAPVQHGIPPLGMVTRGVSQALLVQVFIWMIIGWG